MAHMINIDIFVSLTINTKKQNAEMSDKYQLIDRMYPLAA